MAEKALARDQHCVPALLAQAQMSYLEGFFRTGSSPASDLARSVELANKVEEIDHLNHTPHLIKTYAYLIMGRHDDALFEAQRAHELNPNDPASLVGLGMVEARSGSPALGIEHLLQALRLNPLNPFQHVVHLHLGVACFLSQDYAKGVEWGLKSKLVAPDSPGNLNTLTVNYVGLGRIEEARKEFETANRLAPELLQERLATGSPLYRFPEDRARDARFLRIAAGLEKPT